MQDGSNDLTAWLNPVAVILGGGAGCWCRYAVNWLVAGHPSVAAFPWVTFAINVLGSFVLGLFVVWFRSHPQPVWYLLLGTGFCGGFTTFSTFSVEAIELIERNRWDLAAVYVGGSVAAGLMGAMLAMRIARGVAA